MFASTDLCFHLFLFPSKKRCHSRTAMSRLEVAVQTIAEVFLEYAATDDEKFKLCEAELKTLLEKEFTSPEMKVSDIGRCRNKVNL